MSNSKVVVKNSLIGMIAQFLSMIFGFITQRFFLRFLGLEYVGVNSVIGETLGFLAFAELGIGTSISYRLYKPLVEHDDASLASLINLFRRLYQIIGVVVLLAGSILVFSLEIFMEKTTINMDIIYLAYFIQLVSTASTYFFAYKRSLLLVDQRQFVCKIVDLSMNICFSVLRIISLLIYKEYLVYLVLQFLQTLLSNILLSIYCKKHYEFLKEKNISKYEDKKGLFQDTKNVLVGRIAGYVYSSTDNLVISKFVGLVTAGGFSTYRYVTNSVKNLVYGMTDSIIGTIGNSVQIKNKEENYEMFCKYTFIRYCIANIIATGLCISTDSFVAFAFGKEYILSPSILFLIVADIFIGIVYGPLAEYINVLGLFQQEKNINVIGAIINIGTSILLASVLGVEGVLLGTCISQIFFWISKMLLLFKKYFKSKDKMLKLCSSYLLYIIALVVQVSILHTLKSQLLNNEHNLGTFLIEGTSSVACSLIVITLLFRKTDEYQYACTLVKRMLKIKNRKIKE